LRAAIELKGNSSVGITALFGARLPVDIDAVNVPEAEPFRTNLGNGRR
jgi:hypothetical protein